MSGLYKFKQPRDCPYWLGPNKECGILTALICRTVGECGFYPPTQKIRIEKVREDLTEKLMEKYREEHKDA